MIPKIIHYCWLSNDPIPPQLKKYMDSWKKYLPDYEIMLWDFNRFPKNESVWVQQAFDAKKYAFAADYIRLYALYNYGGIYLDTDVEVIKSLNPLLSNKYIVGYETEIGIEAGVIGAEPRSFWIKKCLDYYKNKTFINENNEYDTLPLPKIIYNILTNNSILEVDIFPFPSDYLTAKSYETGVICITNNTYTIHHFAGSWKSKKDLLKLKIIQFLGKDLTQKIVALKRKIVRY